MTFFENCALKSLHPAYEFPVGRLGSEDAEHADASRLASPYFDRPTHIIVHYKFMGRCMRVCGRTCCVRVCAHTVAVGSDFSSEFRRQRSLSAEFIPLHPVLRRELSIIALALSRARARTRSRPLSRKFPWACSRAFLIAHPPSPPSSYVRCRAAKMPGVRGGKIYSRRNIFRDSSIFTYARLSFLIEELMARLLIVRFNRRSEITIRAECTPQ